MKHLFSLCFFILSLGLKSQEVKKKDTIILLKKDTVLSSKTVKQLHLEALPYYSFGKGVGITSPDSLFQFNIRFRMQNRLEADFNDNRNTEYKAAIRRLRLRFDGYVGNPRFLYAIQLSFAPDDVGEIKEGNPLNIIRDAIVFYKATNKLMLGFGQTKLPGNRQRVNSSGALDLTDRSINNAMFNIDRDFGFQAIYNNTKANEFGYSLKAAITTGEGRNFNDKTDGLAYTGRVELYPLGAFKNNGEFFEGDLQREPTPKIYLGGTYHFNQRSNFSQGQRGKELLESRDLQSILLDGMMKYNGWTATVAYMSRSTSNPLTHNADFSKVIPVAAGHGYDTQLSYIFPKNWEVIGRFSQMTPNKTIQNLIPKQNQLSFGITKYIWEHAFKAQVEVSKNNFLYIDGRKDNNWYARFQVEIGI
ncbi:porin [Riemerella anatipestifer]|uniref:porin n=1 Tax=Riemerella anatipestifer TaxID=34085 RepID=UPI000D14024E|nr:porin [Riemerella anatipestifer]MDD1524972.1 porin [Riemerella anatipestifer]PST44493.1 porin [Riemerella anatipestifer]